MSTTGGTDDRRFMPPKIRRPREEVADVVKSLEMHDMVVAGSWRREKETVGDLDILVPPMITLNSARATVKTHFRYEERRGGELKSEGIASWNSKPLLLNLWQVQHERQWGGLLLFATGPNDLNIMMRANAKGKGLTLSQYGLFIPDGAQLDNGDSETDIFECLDLMYLTPVQRETWRDYLRPTRQADVKTYQVLGSDGEHYYTTTLKDGEPWECVDWNGEPCQGFMYRHKCRHTTEAQERYNAGT